MIQPYSVGQHVFHNRVPRSNVTWCTFVLGVSGSTITCLPAQDAYWTVGRSVLVKNTSSLHPHKKHIALDGRVRSLPTDTRTFALFWTVTRTSDKGEANMELSTATVTANIKIEGFGNKKRKSDVAFEEGDLPQVHRVTQSLSHACTQDE